MRKMEFQSRRQLPITNSILGRPRGGGGMIDQLEALMGSGSSSEDDKSSTGHTPSEFVCGSGPPSPPAVTNPSRSARRKRRCNEEVESRVTRRQKSEDTDASLGGFSSPNESIIDPLPLEDCCLDQSADELQMLCDDFGFEMPLEQCSSSSKEGGREDAVSSGSARQSRRRKIKATVKLLREAIPGGHCMDTAIVLDETIHYVKLLQLRVQTLGAKRLAQRAAAS